MDSQQPIAVTTRTISCDGGDGPLGHPAVYLNFGEKTEIVCPYCSCTFVIAEDANPAAGH
ncbi:MAG: zinc-finger domain-containing protein [Rhodospirillales bacterium]|jgi:uncharacterized Zn-finger protein|nr:zinc-finger domain-containing protein [Rhodospirillales bacterium]MDP7650243.1 zinc-finger domain-containing protein [Rhodospirillales bacterium]